MSDRDFFELEDRVRKLTRRVEALEKAAAPPLSDPKIPGEEFATRGQQCAGQPQTTPGLQGVGKTGGTLAGSGAEPTPRLCTLRAGHREHMGGLSHRYDAPTDEAWKRGDYDGARCNYPIEASPRAEPTPTGMRPGQRCTLARHGDDIPHTFGPATKSHWQGDYNESMYRCWYVEHGTIQPKQSSEVEPSPSAGNPGTLQPTDAVTSESEGATSRASMLRDCTCLGSCKGAAGLAPGWRCCDPCAAINDPEPSPRGGPPFKEHRGSGAVRDHDAKGCELCRPARGGPTCCCADGPLWWPGHEQVCAACQLPYPNYDAGRALHPKEPVR